MLDDRLKDSPTKRLDVKNQGTGKRSTSDEYDFFDELGEFGENEEDFSEGKERDTRPNGKYRRGYEGRSSTRPYGSDRYGVDRSERSQRRRAAGYDTGYNTGYDTRRQRPRKSQKGRANAKSAFTAAYIAVLVVAVAVFVIAFIIGIQWLMESGPRIDIPERPGDESGAELNPNAPLGRPEIRSFTAMINGISSTPRELTLFDIVSNEWRTLPLPEDAEINNRSGNPISFTSLRVGQLIEVRYDARIDEIVTIRESVRARELSNRTNVHINFTENTISVGNDVFRFNSHSLVLHRGEPFDIREIGRDDSITIVAYGDTAWLIQVDAAHGFLQLSNTGNIQNGTITIGNLHPLPLGDINDVIHVTEGLHRIVVEGDNIDTFIDNISIDPGQTLSLDLGNLELRMATLNMTITPSDASVFINDVLLETQGVAIIPFGEHTIRVEHENYEPHEETVDLTDPITNLTVNLVAIPQIGSLVLFSNPANAEVFANGELLGRTPINQELSLGAYAITVRMPGFTDYLFTLTLALGDEYIRTVNLYPATQPATTAPSETQPTTSAPGGDTQEPGRPPLLVIPPAPTAAP